MTRHNAPALDFPEARSVELINLHNRRLLIINAVQPGVYVPKMLREVILSEARLHPLDTLADAKA